MKVVFLDFDGVLNSDRYIRNCEEEGLIIDPARMELLKRIVKSTNSVIVLSTSWRSHWEKNNEECNETGVQINDIFKKYDLEIYDKTSTLFLKREDAIKAWLDTHNQTENFVVLDDAFLSADFLNGHFVKTSNLRDGLDEDDVSAAVSILNGE